jgi:ribosome-associated protein
MTFQLNNHEYIELNKLLKLLQLVESGGMAKVVITEGDVLVNEQVETQIRKKLRAGDIVVFNEHRIEVVA